MTNSQLDREIWEGLEGKMACLITREAHLDQLTKTLWSVTNVALLGCGLWLKLAPVHEACPASFDHL